MREIVYLSMAALILTGCGAFGARAAEEPAYDLIAEDGDIQIRRYGELLVARTEVAGDYDEIGGVAFRRLAGFIFGGNRSREGIAMTAPVMQEGAAEPAAKGEKIPMTSPVLQEESDDDSWIMTFVMPAEYTRDTLPEPLDPLVSIAIVEPKTVATLRFSGVLNHRKFERYRRVLAEWIEDNGYEAVSAPRSAGYNPPWTLPPLRRNEIHIDVR